MPLESHRALVNASKRFDKMSSARQGAYKGGKHQYLQMECGHYFGVRADAVVNWSSWHGRLQRAKAALVAAKAAVATKSAAKKSKRRALLEAEGLDEEEFTEDTGGWVLAAVVWVPLMRSAVPGVSNLSDAMTSWDTASQVLDALGFGSSFVNTLACRTLQQISPYCCRGDIAKIGTGAVRVAQDLCGISCTSAPPMPQLLELYVALKPMFFWLVSGTLGTCWCVLITFQVFQSLLCERRKYEDETRERRPGEKDRHEQYMSVLRPFASAVTIDLDELPTITPKPKLELPEWANVKAVNDVLDLFGALLLRFSCDILGREAPVLRPSSGRLWKTRRFERTRLCQWAHQLDRGSLVCFRQMSRTLSLSDAGWALAFDSRTLGSDQWTELLTAVALGTTVLAEGMAYDRAVSSDAMSSGITSSTLRMALEKAQPVVYPYGRALNGVGGISPLLSGRWVSMV